MTTVYGQNSLEQGDALQEKAVPVKKDSLEGLIPALNKIFKGKAKINIKMYIPRPGSPGNRIHYQGE